MVKCTNCSKEDLEKEGYFATEDGKIYCEECYKKVVLSG